MQFGILGPLELLADGRPVALGGDKQRALLALLLIHANKALSSERLIDELWGERAPASAAKTLQAHISRLRRALEVGGGEGLVVTREHGYELTLDPRGIDAFHFERLFAQAREEFATGHVGRALSLLEEALSLWRGQPLAEFAYERFAESEIARLEELRIGALEQLIETKLTLGRHAEVISDLERLVAENPYRERLRAQLMLALYRSDRQAEALQVYQDARRELVDELGIEPGERLRELERAILAQAPRLAFVETSEALGPAPDASRRVFVGRERELSELTACLDDACTTRGRLVLLVGEPGIGKSRLAEEVGRRASAHLARVFVGRCWEAGGAPAFWPWVQVLRSYMRDTPSDELVAELGMGAADIAAILPELKELIPGLPAPLAPESDGARFRLFHAVTEFLRRASSSRPMVLVLDDLHAADTPSLLLLQFLARQLAGIRALVIAALRDVDPVPDGALITMLAEVSREPITHRLSLVGFTPANVSEYVHAAAAEIASPQLTSLLYAETDGNPLFVSEMVRLLSLEGSDPGGGIQLAMPQSLRDVINRRLAYLSPECRRTLALASVLGREFSLEHLARLTDKSVDALLDILDEAMAARVIGEAPGGAGQLRFSHVVIRDTLYDGLTTARRVRLHRQAVTALEALVGDDPSAHLAELAHHAHAGRDFEKASRYARLAGDGEVTRFAFEEAVRLYQMALDALGQLAQADPLVRCELLLGLGDAEARSGDTPASKSAFLLASELARANHSAAQLARAALGYGGRFVFDASRDDPQLRPLLEEALSALGEGDPELRTRLLARLGAGPLRDEPSRELRDSLTEQAADIARRGGDPSLLAYALDARNMAIWDPASVEARLAITAEMMQLSEAAGDLERLFQSRAYRVWSFLEIGDPEGIATELGAMEQLADQLQQPAQLWMVGVVKTVCSLLEGRFEEAGGMIEDTFKLGERTVPWNAAQAHDLALAVLHREQGRLEQVETIVVRAADANHAYPVWRCVQADLYAQLNRLDEAAEVFERFAATDFAELPVNEVWLFGMSLLSDVCVALDDARRARTLYELLCPYADMHAVCVSEVSLGAVGRPVGNLAATAGLLEQATEALERTIVREARRGARPWAAHAQHDYARVLIRYGDREKARQLIAQALATYEELHMDGWIDRAKQLYRATNTPHRDKA